jgi:hypothetical protein
VPVEGLDVQVYLVMVGAVWPGAAGPAKHSSRLHLLAYLRQYLRSVQELDAIAITECHLHRVERSSHVSNLSGHPRLEGQFRRAAVVVIAGEIYPCVVGGHAGAGAWAVLAGIDVGQPEERGIGFGTPNLVVILVVLVLAAGIGACAGTTGSVARARHRREGACHRRNA